MRHLKRGRKLNRNSSHRKLMFRNMINSLINFEIIKTTLSKAKELRIFIEPLITFSKNNNLHIRRLLFSKIRNIKNIYKLLNVLGPRFKKIFGGYTRILKCGYRKGDNALMAYIEILNRK